MSLDHNYQLHHHRISKSTIDLFESVRTARAADAGSGAARAAVESACDCDAERVVRELAASTPSLRSECR